MIKIKFFIPPDTLGGSRIEVESIVHKEMINGVTKLTDGNRVSHSIRLEGVDYEITESEYYRLEDILWKS